MLLDSPLQETKRREAALKIINLKIKKDRAHLFDLTGLSGGFPLKKGDIDLLETYVGPAVFEEKIHSRGIRHLGGEKVLAVNRTSSGILASILALVKQDDEVVHYLPHLPSHPSIPRSVKLIGAKYFEYDNMGAFKVGNKTSLVIITGSTMDHQILKKEDFISVLEKSHEYDIPVLVDDASGARLRTILFDQPRALDMGADLVITSTDKLMDGPRGGLMAGKKELIDLIRSKAHQFGLEAQPPLIAGMVRAIDNFNPNRILEAKNTSKEIYLALKNEIKKIKETPTGIMLQPEGILYELKNSGITTSLNGIDLANIMAMILLRDYNIVTIPAVGMPGVSPTIRLDMASKDAEKLDSDFIKDALNGALSKLEEVVDNEDACRAILFS